MDIQIIDRNFIQLGRIDEYESFIMTKSYGGIGGFEFHLDSNNIYANALVEENIIFTEEGKAYIILYRKRETDTNKLEIRGIELKGYLNRMLIFPPTEQANYRINSNAESIMKEYVEATLNRKNITNIEVAPNQNRGTSFSYQSRYKNLADELEKISLVSGLGWDITLNMERKKFIFDAVEGRDITVNQDIFPPAIFSVDYDNIGEQILEESKLDYANRAIVAGQGEGKDREIYISGDLDGLDAIELFVDARDIENATDLPDRGIQKLKEVEKTLVFDSQVLTDKNLVYEEDYKLGDIATIQNADWDITVDRRITEITEIYEESGFRLDVTFGEGMPTLIEKIKQVTDTPIAENNVSIGEAGDPGTPGKDGISIEYQWNGTELGIKREDEFNYQYTNLKGEKGDKGDTGSQGEQGIPGLDGKSLEFHWNATQLGIRIEGETTYQYVNLKGEKGDKGEQGEIGLQGEQGIQGEIGPQGETGKSIEYNWNGTSLGVRVEGESSYQYINLKGEKGDTGPPGQDGSDAEVTNANVVNAIGYTPLKETDTIDYSSAVKIKDTRDIDDTPHDFFRALSPSLSFDFKRRRNVGTPDLDISAHSTYAHILTVFGWTDGTGGWPTQFSFGDGKIGMRMGRKGETWAQSYWSDWVKISNDDVILEEVESMINEKDGNGTKVITSATEPTLATGDQWHREY